MEFIINPDTHDRIYPPPEEADPEVHLAWATLKALSLACLAAGADPGVSWERAVRSYHRLCRQPRQEPV